MQGAKTALPSAAVDTTGILLPASDVRGRKSPVRQQRMSPHTVGMFGAAVMILCFVAFVVRIYSAFP